MALVFMDGFETYGTNELLMKDGLYAEAEGSLGMTRVPTGTFSYHVDIGTPLRFVLPGDRQTAGAGYAAWFDTLPVSSAGRAVIFDFRDHNNVSQVYLNVITTGAIEAVRDGVQIGLSNPAITAGAWQHLEARVKVANSGGEVEVRVNGVTVLSLSGIDTQAASSALASCGQIAMFSPVAVSAHSWYVDDFFVWDTTGSFNNGFLGDRRVVTDVANADTTIADWVKSSGVLGYNLINEKPPDDNATYISASSSAVGAKSAFVFGNVSSEVSSIAATQVVVRSIKDEAGPCSVQASILTAINEALGAVKAITSVWTFRWDIFEANPDTGAPWTVTELNATKIAVKRTA